MAHQNDFAVRLEIKKLIDILIAAGVLEKENNPTVRLHELRNIYNMPSEEIVDHLINAYEVALDNGGLKLKVSVEEGSWKLYLGGNAVIAQMFARFITLVQKLVNEADFNHLEQKLFPRTNPY